jgi:hypothetical protein
MKKRIIACIIVFILGLAGCGNDEAVEAIATPTATAAATSAMSTAEVTATTSTSIPTTTAAPETITDYSEMIIEFPKEFLTEKEDPQPPIYEIDAVYYNGELTGNALKLYEDLDNFSILYLKNNVEQYEKRNNIWLTGGQGHAFGLIDIYGNGKPIVFVYSSRGDQGYCRIEFFDMYSDNPLKPLTEEEAFGFCRDGLSYFGKNADGETVLCSGFMHSDWMAQIDFFKLSENTAESEFSLVCDNYFSASYDNIFSENFNDQFREAYDAIDFDVYWLCGDILYHGAEETEYKGKKAYEKYLEFTRNQALLKHITDNQKNIDKLMIDDINNDGIFELVHVDSISKWFTYYSDGQVKTLGSLANWGGECSCGSAPIYYNKNTDEIMIRRTYSDYRDICFYQYTDGDYNLIKQYQWAGFIVPLAIDEWYESPALDALLQEENLTFEDLRKLDEEKLYEYAHTIGYVEKMDQYIFEGEIITQAEWDNAIKEFKSADDCISLCPDNTDLDFVSIRSADFSDYVESKLFNSQNMSTNRQ